MLRKLPDTHTLARTAALIAIAILALGPSVCAMLMSQAPAVPALNCCAAESPQDSAPAKNAHADCPVYQLSLLSFTLGIAGAAVTALAVWIVLGLLRPLLLEGSMRLRNPAARPAWLRRDAAPPGHRRYLLIYHLCIQRI